MRVRKEAGATLAAPSARGQFSLGTASVWPNGHLRLGDSQVPAADDGYFGRCSTRMPPRSRSQPRTRAPIRANSYEIGPVGSPSTSGSP
jgi:hypothetical protein